MAVRSIEDVVVGLGAETVRVRTARDGLPARGVAGVRRAVTAWVRAGRDKVGFGAAVCVVAARREARREVVVVLLTLGVVREMAARDRDGAVGPPVWRMFRFGAGVAA